MTYGKKLNFTLAERSEPYRKKLLEHVAINRKSPLLVASIKQMQPWQLLQFELRERKAQ